MYHLVSDTNCYIGHDAVSPNSPSSAGIVRRSRHCRVTVVSQRARARSEQGVVNGYPYRVIVASTLRTQRRATAGLAAGLMIAASVAIGGHRVSAETPIGATPEDAVEALAELVTDADGVVGVSGEEAVEMLVESGTTELAAENAGMEPDELVEELIEDPTMFVTAQAMVGYLEEAPTSEELAGSESLTAAPLGAPAGVDVFNLSSRPSSGKVIYLDLDGHTTTGDFWNSPELTGIPSLYSAPYVNPATATDAQRDAVYEIWRRVAEDYLPFDVNVTTRDPGPAGLRKTSPGDQSYGQRMVITPTNWIGSGTLGVALLFVFDDSVDRSAFVFTAGLSPRVIAEAVSHEAGHTLGLSHDGTTTGAEYYDGHGNWAPIMGRSISPRALVTQWSKGEYTNANNREDDVVGIASYTGFRADDHASVAAFATLVGSNSTTSGVIGAGGDVDVFVVDAGPGTIDVTVTPALREGTNLHARVTVRDPAGNVVSAQPTDIAGWTSTVSIEAPAQGRYTIEVRSSSWLTPTSGFSTYGSMGAYELEVTDTPPTDPVPPPPPPLPETSLFNAVAPARLLDTRTGAGGSTRIPAGGQIAVQVAGRAGVPVGATGAVLSVVAVDPAGAGFLTTYPCTARRPTASTVNFVRGQIVANTATATLSASGQLCVHAHATTDVVIDVTGYLARGTGSAFTPVGPVRVMDTRTGLGGARRLAAGGMVRLPASAVPAGATAVALNVTSDAASGPGFATVYPCATGRPGTSTLNFVAGDVRPNNTIVGVNGGVCIFSLASTEIIVDLVGYFGATGLSYLPTAPARLIDTRDRSGLLPAGSKVTYRPATASLGTYSAQSASVNVTAVDHVANGFVTTYDCLARGTTSTVNARVGEVNANGAIVPLGNGVDSCLFTQSGGDFVVDLNGWWVR